VILRWNAPDLAPLTLPPADLLRGMRLRLADNRSLLSSGITWLGAGCLGAVRRSWFFLMALSATFISGRRGAAPDSAG